MPGITGSISSVNREVRQNAVEIMVQSMLHEPFYRSGTFSENSLNLSIGWVCHPRSFSDCLPIWNETKDVVLVFVGENFADQTDVDRLRAQGHSFEPHAASYLVHLYEEIGTGFFEKLNGVYSGVLIDLRERKVVLFNDRYGLGRVYVHESPDGFFFSSEAKSLLKVLPHLRNLDMRSLGEQFSCGCVMQNRTLFSGISLLPGGSVWTFKLGPPARKENCFDQQAWQNQPPLELEHYYEKLKETFSRILPRYIQDADRMAMSLTGGLDSRLIMAWGQFASSKVSCYSHRGAIRECADSRIAQNVAKVCGQTHRTITVDGRFFSEFPSLATKSVYLTDGAMEVGGGASGLFVNRIARSEIAPVRMTGNYGGEILRHLLMFGPSDPDVALFTHDFAVNLSDAELTFKAEQNASRVSFVAFKQMPWFHYARFALEQSQLTIRSPYLDNELVKLAFQSPLESSVNLRLAGRLIADGNPALAAFPTDRGPLGREGVWGKIREQYQEFTYKAEYAYDQGMPQWLAKLDYMIAPLHFDRLFLGRHKYCHYRTWYRHEFSNFVREVLLDPQSLSRPYLNGRRVAQIVNAHIKGYGNYTQEIHSLLTAELIHRTLIEQY